MVKFVAKVKRIHFTALTSCGTNYFSNRKKHKDTKKSKI
jgi:hypothetical protein